MRNRMQLAELNTIIIWFLLCNKSKDWFSKSETYLNSPYYLSSIFRNALSDQMLENQVDTSLCAILGLFLGFRVQSAGHYEADVFFSNTESEKKFGKKLVKSVDQETEIF